MFENSASGAGAAPVAARIGIVLHDFAAGGTERIIIRLANAWADAGREVTIFCGSEAGPARDSVGPLIKVRRANPEIRRGLFSRYRLGRDLRAAINRHPVDVLVAPGNFHLPVLLAAGRLPCATVCKISNPLDRRSRGVVSRAAFLLSARAAARHVDRLVAMSPALAAEIRAILGTPLETIPDPILTGHRPGRASRGGMPIVLCAGRLVSQKAFSLALKTLAMLDDVRLLIAGDGPDRPALEAEAKRLGIATRVTFAGNVPDIAPLLDIADSLLLTSAYEGYPAVLVEAIAAGVPVVTTDCSAAIAEIVSPGLGLVAAAEPVDLAAALRQTSSLPRIGEAARQELIARHHIDAGARAWLAALDRAAADVPAH